MRNIFLVLLMSFAFAACKKEQTPPVIVLKTGGSYVSGDITVSPGTQITVGVNASKTMDNLNLFYTEVAYDGANTNALMSRVWLTGDERSLYSKDITITVRNQTGTERWVFNVNDSEGRISKQEIRVSVQ